MGSGPPQHGSAGFTGPSLHSALHKCLDIHNVPEKSHLIPLLKREIMCPQNHVWRSQPDFHFATCSVYKLWPNSAAKSQALVRGEGLGGWSVLRGWAGTTVLCLSSLAQDSLTWVVSYIKACNCVNLSTHSQFGWWKLTDVRVKGCVRLRMSPAPLKWPPWAAQKSFQ